jgi:DNA/RNA endonuclease YhcR with UshA esterase domain
MRHAVVGWTLVALLGSRAAATAAPLQRPAQALAAVEAARHVGRSATVCGEVVTATYASRSRGQPTFLNLDRPYPNQVFTVVIWGEDRKAFGRPEVELLGKVICVTGRIEQYQGRPQIVAREAKQITVVGRGGSGRR